MKPVVPRRQVVGVGSRVRFEGAEYVVAGLDGPMVRLGPAGERGPAAGGPAVVLLTHLLAAGDFEVLSASGPSVQVGPLTLLRQDLPAEVVERATWWERHVVEVLTGLAPDAVPGTPPRPEYDPVTVSLRARETAKTQELRAAGERVSLGTVQRMRRRYQRAGVAGLVDGRLAPAAGPLGGRVDPRVVDAVREAMAATPRRRRCPGPR